jgi:hypothetical protein
MTKGQKCDAPGFHPGLLTLTIRSCQTTVNLGYHLENITNNP